MKKIICLSGIALLLMSAVLTPDPAAGRDPDAYNVFDMDNAKKIQQGLDDARIKPPDTGRNKENNPERYESFQDCYVNNISDVSGISIPVGAGEERKAAVKEYCRAIFTVKQRKAFTDCFTSRLGKGTPVDRITTECAAASTAGEGRK